MDSSASKSAGLRLVWEMVPTGPSIIERDDVTAIHISCIVLELQLQDKIKRSANENIRRYRRN